MTLITSTRATCRLARPAANPSGHHPLLRGERRGAGPQPRLPGDDRAAHGTTDRQLPLAALRREVHTQ
nr:hypothetical protein [Streptomyces umbrinus]